MYLNDIPRTYQYIEKVINKYESMSNLKNLFIKLNIKGKL